MLISFTLEGWGCLLLEVLERSDYLLKLICYIKSQTGSAWWQLVAAEYQHGPLYETDGQRTCLLIPNHPSGCIAMVLLP